MPVLAIEVDGFHYHKEGTRQAERDQMKDDIFTKYGIPLLRLPTNGSGEIQKIKNAINPIVDETAWFTPADDEFSLIFSLTGKRRMKNIWTNWNKKYDYYVQMEKNPLFTT